MYSIEKKVQYTLAIMNPYIMNNFWLSSGSTSIEIMLKNFRYNEQLDIMNGFGLHLVGS
jgi:hypothetical protein